MTDVAKSETLMQREEGKNPREAPSPLIMETEIFSDGPIKIREVPCYNDFAAILQFEINLEGGLELPGESKLKPEGLVVGVGPGLAQNGARTPSQLKVGDVVLFQPNQVVTTINSQSGVYAGKTVRIIPERAIFCKLQPVPYEVVNENA
jgi:co-chaperonin GroES (HSP10)